MQFATLLFPLRGGGRPRRVKSHPAEERPPHRRTTSPMAISIKPKSRRSSKVEPDTGEHRPAGVRPPVIELRDLTQVYPGGHVGLDHVSLTINRGEFAFVVGPTGCGKSTLIKVLMREAEPAGGSVKIAGRAIFKMPAKKV